ncbi:helix-turn-helix domain-containing protein [Sphaerisporangium sp. NPDC088356]|uniref:helix-turn-helix domain-containing protein n=1 Tax=Sphaerisporangium sp. NPDC088356 TaxID=3154871 RepID=UPI003418EE40
MRSYIEQVDAGRQESGQLVEWMRSMIEIARAVSEGMPLAPLFTLVAETAASLTRSTACAVQMADPSGTCLLIVGHAGLSGDYIERVNTNANISLEEGSPYFNSPSSRAYRTHEIIAVDDALDDESYSPWQSLAEQEGYRSLIAVPMLADGEPIGVLAVYSSEPAVTTPQTLMLCQLLAEHSGLALAMARLHDRERHAMARLLEANASLEQQQQVIDQVDDLHRGLMRVVLQNGDLGSVAGALRTVMGMDVVIEDAAGERLAAAPPDATGIEVWTQGPQAREALARLEAERTVVHIDRPEAGRPRAWVAPIALGDEIVGRLWASGTDSAPSELQRRLLERAALVATVELWQERSAREIEWRLSGDLFDELIRADGKASADLLARGLHLGHDLSEPHDIVLLSVWSSGSPVTADGGEALRRSALAAVERSLRRRDLSGLLAWREDYVAVLLDADPDGDRAARIRVIKELAGELSRSVRGGDVVAAVSQTCREADSYARVYQAARGALTVARRGRSRRLPDPPGPGVRVIDAESLGIYSVLLSASRTSDLLQLRDDALGALKKQDQRRDGALLETLKEYLRSDCHVQQTATAMYLHPNTVLYRLRAIEKVTEVDLKQPRELLRLQLAVMVDDLAEEGVGALPG